MAAQLGYAYIDTGAMYRTVTLRFLAKQLPFSEETVTELAKQVKITFRFADGLNRVFESGEEVTEAIRSLEVTQHVSQVAAVGGVRAAMVEAQREIRAGRRSNGRPGHWHGGISQAELKVFLTASVEERANRRYLEMKEKARTWTWKI